MTQQDITRLRVINQTTDAVITIREATEILNLSERQVISLKKGVLKQGPAFIIHKNRGRKPAHALTDGMKEQITRLKLSKYQEANFARPQIKAFVNDYCEILAGGWLRIKSRAG